MKRRILWPAGFSTALLACGGGGGNGGNPNPDPPSCSTGIETPLAFENLDFTDPVALMQAPNDGSRWFVVEQGGRIFAFENVPAAEDPVEFIDLRSRVHQEGEAGLLGMAFHPDFATNGRVYLNFSELVGAQLRSITAEYTSADGGQTLDPASERILLRVNKGASNHNGGNISFGPDGYLYIGLGDGGGAGDPQGNGQNAERLLGKMLRIDVDSQPDGDPYGIPGGASGNPFAGNDLCNVDGTGVQPCPEIYALGFRNPWRWSFDRQSGDLWVGDVGQADWEEIDVVPANPEDTAAIGGLLARTRGVVALVGGVEEQNEASHRCVRAAGFVAVPDDPDEEGFINYVLRLDPAGAREASGSASRSSRTPAERSSASRPDRPR